MGDVTLLKGNAAEMGFDQLRVGHELARSIVLQDGSRALSTPTGRTFKVTKF